MSVVSRESFSFFFFHLMYCLMTFGTEGIGKWYDKILSVDNIFQTALHEILLINTNIKITAIYTSAAFRLHIGVF